MKKLDLTICYKINKGWSNDELFCVLKNNTKLLLRVSNLKNFETKKQEFEMMQQLSNMQIPMCNPVEFGVVEEEVYSLQSWIEGKELDKVINHYSEDRQYHFGEIAGKILKKIHSIKAPLKMEAWDKRFNHKMDKKIEGYQLCSLKYKHGDLFLKWIEENRGILKDRPQTFQHGDYHIGNLMLNEKEEIIVIDFNRFDFGDPWEEFNRIVWCVAVSPMFATGMINGYFDDNVPMEFWKLLKLYITSNTLSSLPWAIPFGEEEIKTMIVQAENILQWYDFMKKDIPLWYSGIN